MRISSSTRKTSLLGLTLLGALLTGMACGDLGAALDGQECFSDDECGPLNCVVNLPIVDSTSVNSTGIGWCLEQTSCVIGEQPYCGCGLDPNTNGPLCETFYDSNKMVQTTVPCWDEVNMASCLCIPSQAACPYDPEEGA